jgi:hypothetical protein
MKFSGEWLYRVRITDFPEGALTRIADAHGSAPDKWSDDEWDEWSDVWILTPGWRPPGWQPEGNYVQIMGTDEFVWPVTNKVYGSRSTAKKRADLLESYGAKVVIERSSRITWPE